jgi:hypothetical protein
MRRRVLEPLLSGLVLLAFVVGAFIHYAHRDARTLQDGTRVQGLVVDTIKRQWFDFMSDGRLVVTYDLGGDHHESKVWLDNDRSEYHIGQEVTVIVRGSHVRTTREPNDPSPVGCALILVGLLGLGLTGDGLLRLRRPVAAPPPDSAVLARIPLRTFRIAPRRAVIDVTATELQVFLPAFFGRRRLTVPISNAAMECYPEDERELESEYDAGDELYFKDVVRIANFPTASALKDGNLLLLFREPVRAPPLRWYMALNNDVSFPFGFRESRSETGAWIDGALLRADDPRAACEELRRVGVTQVEAGIEWLGQHRELETDPEAQQAIQAEAEQEARGHRWRGLLWGAGWVLAVIGQWRDDFRFLGVALGLLAVAGLWSWWSNRAR